MVALPAVAHHTFAMFDWATKVQLQGTVKELRWTNPHCYLQLLVTRDGDVQEWSLQMNAPMDLYHSGWRPTSLKPGDQVTVVINPAKAGQNSGRFVSAVGPDGKKLSSG
ncbi:MAG TPA: DUF6152 family protein [Steroidobacteraceae bacterium]|jgi:hypothetical protein|nr:DUF6152 family protein [Steroidobacteraceae bacterium]